MGSIGSHQSAQDQANYTNESNNRQYKHALMVREAKWYNQIANWNNQRTDYKKTLHSNNEAAGRAYASEQQRLNEMYQQAAFSNQDMLTKLLQASGMSQATGQSGQSLKRNQDMHLAAYGRNNAVVAEKLASAKNAMNLRNETVWHQQKSANNQAWNQVAMAPVQDIAPPVPVQAPGPSGLGLAAGLLGAAASGASAFSQLKAPNAFDAGNGFNSADLGLNYGNGFGGFDASKLNFNPSTFNTPAFSTFQFSNPFKL